MPIKYVLTESPFSTTDPGAHVARVLRTSTAEFDEIIAIMAQQGCTIFKADIKSVLEAYHSAIEYLLLHGHNVNAEGAKYRVVIGGTFTGSGDAFDPARHQARVRVRPGQRILQALEHAEWEKVEPNKPLPHPMHYTDIATGKQDLALTPGGVGQVTGYRLRFDPTDPEQGVFLVNPAGTATRAVTIVKNRLGEAIFVVPDLPAGEYRLEVRARVRDGDELRTGTLDKTLTAG